MSRPSTARLFIALDVPAKLRTELAAWGQLVSARLGGARPVRLLDADSMHLTICFLGSRAVAQIEPLAALVEDCPQPAMGEASLGAPLWLPTRRPRALAVEVHDDARSLAALHRVVLEELAKAGLAPPGDHAARHVAQAGAGRRRPLKPHITVIRMHPDGRRGNRELAPTPKRTFVPERLVLYRSWLTRDGAEYEAIASASTTPMSHSRKRDSSRARGSSREANNCSVRGEL